MKAANQPIVIRRKQSLTRNSCLQVTLLVSLFWIFVNALILMYVIDMYGGASYDIESFSDDEIGGRDIVAEPDPDKNEYELIEEVTNPPEWPGEAGVPVEFDESLEREAEKRFSENQFNIVASDYIALNRSLPDFRDKRCLYRKYPTDLPTTSIVIVLHNEANSTLLRGLTSIVNRSPRHLLKEIIVVNDASVGREYLHGSLRRFVDTLPVRVKLIHNEIRMGLIKSRLIGAEAANAETLTFLDAHIECSKGWLPPLLMEIKKDRKTVVCPVIDIVNDQTFEYQKGSSDSIGIFDQELVFGWDKISARDHLRRGLDYSMPFRTPTMAGGLFSIDRAYFYEIGSYDEGMEIWGAENVEISLRIWMCGGTLLISPCSRVGHVFRRHSPYSFPGGADNIIQKNTRRVIDVWTDEFKAYFYKIIPGIRETPPGQLAQRKELRHSLKCRSFRWFLENVYPEAPVPYDTFHLGQIKNDHAQVCLDNMDNNKAYPGVYECQNQDSLSQVFGYTKWETIMNGGYCLDLDTESVPVRVDFSKCDNQSLSQKWTYNRTIFKNREYEGCLTMNNVDHSMLVLAVCNPQSKYQQWRFINPII